MSLFHNYQYSLTGEDQDMIQVFLRLLPKELQAQKAWKLLHKLTYAQSWSQTPQFTVRAVANEKSG